MPVNEYSFGLIWNTLDKIKQKQYLSFTIYILLCILPKVLAGVEDFACAVQISQIELVWTDDKTVLNYQSHVSND